MKQKDLLRRVRELVLPLCAEAGVTLWDVTFEKESRGHLLTVFIDREAGVGIEHCETVSRALSPLLDAPVFDSLPAYTLCVSSPGLERRLANDEHLEWALGKTVDVSFFRGGDRTGELLGYDEKQIRVLTAEGETAFDRADIGGMHLHFDF